MIIRKATQHEMLALWGYQNEKNSSPTATFFAENILSENAEFFTIEKDGVLIGELYAFKSLSDPEFADGHTKAYLCAFRIHKDYRGQGLGTQLMNTVLEHLKECGFTHVTIGVDITEEANIRLYQRLGFHTKVKDCYFDLCDLDENMQPKACSCYWLLIKNLV